MKSKSGLLMITLVSVILGLMLAVQFKVTQSNSIGPSERVQDLATRLKQAEVERDRLKSEVEDLRKKITNTSTNEALASEMEKARQAAGLVALKGPGITVTLNDSPKTVHLGEDPNLYLIHDEDLLKVVNELKAAGAEAIAVNDQRIIAMSEIRCAGPNILVNVKKIAPPFVITAIGNPDLLESSLRMKGGIIETLQVWNIQVKIEKSQNLKVPAYNGPIKFEYAIPVKEGE
ncbi:MAG: DUF881 domain-containing protein [Firmicutes bacterium]|nr:DUF881 domain-containing protein [Bacillota bacterium]